MFVSVVITIVSFLYTIRYTKHLLWSKSPEAQMLCESLVEISTIGFNWQNMRMTTTRMDVITSIL